MKKKSNFICVLAVCMLAASACAETEPHDRGHESLLEENFGNYNYRIFATSSRAADAVLSAGMTGAVVNDAVFDKICAVNEKYNCSVTLSAAASEGNAEAIGRSILAGQDDFDLCLSTEENMASMCAMGCFCDLNGIQEMHLDEPWYITDGFALGGQIYLFSGDISYYGMSRTYMLFFNKVLFDKYQIPYPYDDVLNHNWTLAKMQEIVRNGYDDVNGNGQMEENRDIFGYISGGDYDGIPESFGIDPFRVTGPGEIIYEPDGEAYARIAQSFYSMIFGRGGWLAKGGDTARSLFRNGHSLFFFDEFGAATLSFSETSAKTLSWGTLPMPLIEETQEHYYSCSRDYPAAIPVTADAHLKKTALITEALAQAGREYVYPVYYELAMKARYSTDEIDAKMVDLIMENRRFSFSHLYGGGKDINSILLPALFDPKDPGFDTASFLESQKGIQKGIADDIAEAFARLNEANKQ